MDKSMLVLNKVERIALRMYLEYSNRQKEWESITIFQVQSILRYPILPRQFEKKKIPTKDIEKIENAFIWIDLFSKREMRNKIEILENYIQDNYGYYNNYNKNIDVLQNAKEQIKDEIQKINDEIKKDRQKRKLISEKMNMVISNLPMGDKISINPSLEIISEDKKISLSSGE